jgi:hypothetical protein
MKGKPCLSLRKNQQRKHFWELEVGNRHDGKIVTEAVSRSI